MSRATLCATRALAGLLALLLSACAGSKPQPPACPTVLLLKGAERTAGYRTGTGTRPADLEHLAVLKNLVSACRYDEAGVDVALRFDMIAEQGPAYAAREPLLLTYFVATLDPDQAVLSKPLFSSEVLFAEGRKVAGNVQQMTVRVPGAVPADGARYRIYVGFQLDDRELTRRLRRRAL